jgi:hypothetical protein
MKTGRGCWALAGVVLLTLLGLYVGAYFALVTQVQWGKEGEPLILSGWRTKQPELCDRIFWPINQIDRKFIRPRLWTP